MIRAYMFTAASERVVARLKKDLFSHLIEQASSPLHLGWDVPYLPCSHDILEDGAYLVFGKLR